MVASGAGGGHAGGGSRGHGCGGSWGGCSNFPRKHLRNRTKEPSLTGTLDPEVLVLVDTALHLAEPVAALPIQSKHKSKYSAEGSGQRATGRDGIYACGRSVGISQG